MCRTECGRVDHPWFRLHALGHPDLAACQRGVDAAGQPLRAPPALKCARPPAAPPIRVYENFSFLTPIWYNSANETRCDALCDRNLWRARSHVPGGVRAGCSRRLIRLLGDFDLAEDALQDAFAAAARAVAARRDARPTRAPGSCRPAASRRSTRSGRRSRTRYAARRSGGTARGGGQGTGSARDRTLRRGGRRGRPAAPDLHVLPSGPASGRAG